MTTPSPDSIRGLRPDALDSTAAPSKATEAGPAFRALLDQLEERARALEEASKTLEGPQALAGAMDTARASLEDALSLSDSLVEAYRQARQQDPDQTR